METLCGGDPVSLGELASALCERFDGTMVPGDGAPCYEGPAGNPIRIKGNIWDVECYGPDGKLKWKEKFGNTVTLAGLDSVLNVYLVDATQIPTWYIGLVDNSGFTAFAGTDTMASHGGWSENASYSGSTRPAWTPGSSSGQSVTNASTVNFSITASCTIRGLFLVSLSDRGGTDGLLFSTAAFTGGNQACNSGDTLKATYTVSATSSS